VLSRFTSVGVSFAGVGVAIDFVCDGSGVDNGSPDCARMTDNNEITYFFCFTGMV